MIKLTLPSKPEKLAAKEAELTAEFKADNRKAVWKKEYISTPLLEMTSNKCAYSETKVNRKSAYMEIEHFKHKDMYPEDVVRWGNLLPSCKKCNTTKGTLDVVSTPIVNPIYDNPKDHLYVRSFRYYPKDTKGKNTIKAVALNDNTHFTNPRAETAFDIAEKLEREFAALKKADCHLDRNKCLSALKTILTDCGPTSEFSAVVATYVLYEWDYYCDLENYLRVNYYWDDDFETLKEMLMSISMPNE